MERYSGIVTVPGPGPGIPCSHPLDPKSILGVGRVLGERACLHVRPGRLTMLECRFNKTTHNPKSNADRTPAVTGEASTTREEEEEEEEEEFT